MSVAARPSQIRRTPVSLTLADELPIDEWRQIGVELAHLARRTPWWLGDWLFYGETKYGSSTPAYDEAVAATGLDRDTLMNYKSVAGKFSVSRRRENLTLSHHADVLRCKTLDEQEYWLTRAEKEAWSQKALREEIAAVQIGGAASEGTTLVPFSFRTDEERVERWRHAALLAGLKDAKGEPDVRTWALNVLDQAAA